MTMLDMRRRIEANTLQHLHQPTRLPPPIKDEQEYWPPPPPPLLEETPAPTKLPQDELMTELAAQLKSLGQEPPQPPSPDSWDHDDGSQVSDETQGEPGRQHGGETSYLRHVPAHPPHFSSPSQREKSYRGPKPTIPMFTKEDSREFTRLKMALENILPENATERFKYQVLLDHLKFEEALLIADSYSNSLYPYRDTMASLTSHYGQPHQLALQRIAEVMDGPTIRSGDTASFKKFALHVRALVGMLDQLGEEGTIELQCGSHVVRLTAKLPHDMRANFKRYIHPLKIKVPTLLNFADWLEYELEIQQSGLKYGVKGRKAQRRRETNVRTPRDAK